MPEYLAPGVYVEETSFRSKSIEGVSTTTTGLIGPARYGPVTETPELLTSLGEFERVYGGGEQLEFKANVRLDNYLWHGVRAFFSEGGKRLYVARVFRQIDDKEYVAPAEQDDAVAGKDGSNYRDGHARTIFGGAGGVSFRARFPGAAGNVRLQLALRLGSKFPRTAAAEIESGAVHGDLVYVQKRTAGATPVNVATLLTELTGANGAVSQATTVSGFVNNFVDEAIQNSTDAANKAAAAGLEVNLRAAIFQTKQAAGELASADSDRAKAEQIIADANASAVDKAKAAQALIVAKSAIIENATSAVSTARTMVTLTKLALKSVRSADQAETNTAAQNADTKLAAAVVAAGSTVIKGSFLLVTVANNTISLVNDSNQPVILTVDDDVRSVALRLELLPAGSDIVTQVWDNVALDPQKMRNGVLDNLFSFFTLAPANQDLARTLPIVVRKGTNVTNGLQALVIFFDVGAMITQLGEAIRQQKQPEFIATITLTGGSDGLRPGVGEYEGKANPDDAFKTGLKQFEDIEDISIVAAPGATYRYQSDFHDNAIAIMSQLINHARTMRYRIAVLDSGDALSISAVRELRARFDSTYGAFYYPWVRIIDPITRQEINLPPSGFVAGIYARNDINRAVWKAPANEVVNLALGFEKTINKAQQDVLNPEGINCFRFFEGRGMLLWGARTISSDPEWKYVNLRRYFAYLERSIDRGTQWAVFEPNGEALWANVRRTIEDFLLNEWMMGALLGDKPEKAYFVKCDRTTMTQNDLDNGRLVCLIGVAPLRPAEFVIFRIGQWTGDRKV